MTDESAMVRREEDEYEIDARPRQWETLACGFKLRFRLRVVRVKLPTVVGQPRQRTCLVYSLKRSMLS